MNPLEDQFVASLLGLALGDALGAPYEGSLVGPAAAKKRRGPLDATLRYTDDTEMALILARSLVEHRGVRPEMLAKAWALGAQASRGYGYGAARVLALIRAGEDWRTASRSVFPEGSFGNGAAMRAAPIGLWFHHDPEGLAKAAELAASITHGHPLGIEGGVLMARATAMALEGELDLAVLAAGCREAVFCRRLSSAEDLTMDFEAVARTLGHGVQAHESVVTAIHVARRFTTFEPMLEFVISLGGDVDTIGAMAGALFGARNGTAALPVAALDRLEDRVAIGAAARALAAAAPPA
jgi:ADP-ribosylglycohydrolase